MDATRWIFFVGGAVAAIGYVSWWYRSREEPVPGRLPAALLRAAGLTLAWLILLNPEVDGAGGGERVTTTLLDASYSMSRPERPGAGPVWRVAREVAGRTEAVWLFGGETPRRVHGDSLPLEPLYGESRLTPAVRAAAAAGAGRAVVISDGRIDDLMAAGEEARRRGLSLSFAPLRTDYAEYGIARVDAPTWARLGDTVDVELEVVASQGAPDSLLVDVVDESGSVMASGRVRTAGQGRFVPLVLRVPVTGAAGARRYAARLTPSFPDPEARDNRRPVYLRVSERPPGPVLISLRPDWEPSFMAPVLDRLTDSPTGVYLWFAEAFVEVGSHRRLGRDEVLRRGRDAPILVLHGYGADAPDWARDLAERAERLALLPAGDRAFELPGRGVRVGAAATGEWYVSETRPGSPLALELAGIDPAGLTPLVRLRVVEGQEEWVPLNVQRLRRGTPLPAAVAGRSGRSRWVVAAGEGYWRWAFRPGPGRGLYRGLWTGLAGWLLEGRERATGAPGPVRRVVGRGEPLIWPAPSEVDSLALQLRPEGEGGPLRYAIAGGDSAVTPLPPGRYRYRTELYRDDSLFVSGNGVAEVEEFSRELLPRTPGPPLDDIRVPATSTAAGSRRSLAELWWPYLLVIALFCAEWTVRRLAGLR